MPEEVQYSHSADIPGLILGTARFAEFRFEPHYHLDCHIGHLPNLSPEPYRLSNCDSFGNSSRRILPTKSFWKICLFLLASIDSGS
jgi:hypothetical protein